jgi:hypothetical protein
VDSPINRMPNTNIRGMTLPTRNLIRRKQQENPLLGEYRMHGAFKQLGIAIVPRTCGRILAENRRWYEMESAVESQLFWDRTRTNSAKFLMVIEIMPF